MLSIWPVTWIVLPGASCFLKSVDDLVDIGGDAAEIAALSAGIDLVDRLDVGLVGAARHRVAGEGRDIAELARNRRVAGGAVVVLTDAERRDIAELPAPVALPACEIRC